MNLEERNYIACIQQGYDAWQTGDDYAGLSWFQQACLLWLDELNGAGAAGAALSQSTCVLLSGHLAVLLEALERGDISSASDLIGHTLLPSLQGGSQHGQIHS